MRVERVNPKSLPRKIVAKTLKVKMGTREFGPKHKKLRTYRIILKVIDGGKYTNKLIEFFYRDKSSTKLLRKAVEKIGLSKVKNLERRTYVWIREPDPHWRSPKYYPIRQSRDKDIRHTGKP